MWLGLVLLTWQWWMRRVHGFCNVTILENLPVNTIIPLALGYDSLTLLDGQNYFQLEKHSMPDHQTKVYDHAPIWTFSEQSGDKRDRDDPWFLKLRSPLDREKFCQDASECDCAFGNSDPRLPASSMRKPCRFPVRLMRRKNAHFNVVQLSVCIADVNDNRPQFPVRNSMLDLEIEEESNNSLGHSIPLPTAHDADAGPENTVNNYSLQCQTRESLFQLEQDPLNSSLALRIRSRLDFDRESGVKWPLKCLLTASDAKYDGILHLNIKLRDVNDNTPMWQKPIVLNPKITVRFRQKWILDLPEDVPILTGLVKFSATDADRDFGSITYRVKQLFFADGQQSNFTLHSQNGVLELRRPLDYASFNGQPIKLQLTARDNGGRENVTELEVNVLDVNNHAPIIRISGEENDSPLFGGPFHGVLRKPLRMIEETAEPQLLAMFKVTDLDSPDNGNVTCYLAKADESVREKLSLNRHADDLWSLTAVEAVDRDAIPTLHTFAQDMQQSQVKVTLACRDNPKAAHERFRESFLTLPIAIQDVNDNEPVFVTQPTSPTDVAAGELAVFTFDVVENLANGTEFGRIEVTDPDIGSQLTFELKTRHPVAIDRRTGVLRTLDKFDREECDVYKDDLYLTVMDSDNASEAHLLSARLVIRILDENDNRPKWNEHQVFRVPESLPPGSLVTTLLATDQDAGDNGTVSYEAIPPLYSSPFRIQPRSNALLLAPGAKLDRESQAEHLVRILAVDHGTPHRLTSTATLTILIEDENDNRPLFKPQLRYKQIRVACPSNGQIFTLEAEDRDEQSDNSQINYRLLDVREGFGTPTSAASEKEDKSADLFTVDPSSGLLAMHEAQPDCSVSRTFSLKVLAFDPTKPDFNDTIQLTVHVQRHFVTPTGLGDTALDADHKSHLSQQPFVRGSWDYTVYGVVILVCVSVGLCLLLILLLIYFKYKYSLPEWSHTSHHHHNNNNGVPAMATRPDQTGHGGSDQYSMADDGTLQINPHQLSQKMLHKNMLTDSIGPELLCANKANSCGNDIIHANDEQQQQQHHTHVQNKLLYKWQTLKPDAAPRMGTPSRGAQSMRMYPLPPLAAMELDRRAKSGDPLFEEREVSPLLVEENVAFAEGAADNYERLKNGRTTVGYQTLQGRGRTINRANFPNTSGAFKNYTFV